MKYKKITKDDVFNIMVSCDLDFMSPICGIINLVNIASLLKTSRYQVKKEIEDLKKEGLVKLEYFYIDPQEEEELFPPYWGYVLTDKARSTEIYIQKAKRHSEIIKEIWGE